MTDFSVWLLPLLFEDQHRIELVGSDLFDADIDAQFQHGAQVERAPEEQA